MKMFIKAIMISLIVGFFAYIIGCGIAAGYFEPQKVGIMCGIVAGIYTFKKFADSEKKEMKKENGEEAEKE